MSRSAELPHAPTPLGDPDAHSGEHALWLEIATAGLWNPARTLIATETRAHLEQAEAQGFTPEQALTQLGSPYDSARVYRTHHLSAQEMEFLPLLAPFARELGASPAQALLKRSILMLPFTLIGLAPLGLALTHAGHINPQVLDWPVLGFCLLLLLPPAVFFLQAPRLLRRLGTFDGARATEHLLTVCTFSQMGLLSLGLGAVILSGFVAICGCTGLPLIRSLDADTLNPPLVLLLLLLLGFWWLLKVDHLRRQRLERAHTLYGLQDEDLTRLA